MAKAVVCVPFRKLSDLVVHPDEGMFMWSSSNISLSLFISNNDVIIEWLFEEKL